MQMTDFQATASKPRFGPFTAPAVGGWYTFNVNSVATYINKAAINSGLTQFRKELGGCFFTLYHINVIARQCSSVEAMTLLILRIAEAFSIRTQEWEL
jgi:hypothetical protein